MRLVDALNIVDPQSLARSAKFSIHRASLSLDNLPRQKSPLLSCHARYMKILMGGFSNLTLWGNLKKHESGHENCSNLKKNF